MILTISFAHYLLRYTLKALFLACDHDGVSMTDFIVRVIKKNKKQKTKKNLQKVSFSFSGCMKGTVCLFPEQLFSVSLLCSPGASEALTFFGGKARVCVGPHFLVILNNKLMTIFLEPLESLKLDFEQHSGYRFWHI